MSKLCSKSLTAAAIDWLHRRNVRIRDIAQLVLDLQKEYLPDLSLEECCRSVEKVLKKREVQNALLTGIQLDILAEEKKLISPLQEMVFRDEGLFGCDEVLALSIVNVYGSIGLTNFGYIDKLKPGILHDLNSDSSQVNTFLDDIVGAIAASASSRIAHAMHDKENEQRSSPLFDTS
jgi:phosphatidylglycerophosphatase A